MGEEAKEEEFRICRVCGKLKLLSEFHKDKTKYLGRRTTCKECAKDYAKEYRKTHREECLELGREYYKDHKKDLCNYGKEYRKTHREEHCKYYKQYYKDHRKEKLELAKEYQKSHKGRRREYMKNYLQTATGRLACRICRHRRRARKLAAGGDGISAEQWQRIIIKQKNKCNICHRKFTKTRPATMDHIVPISKEGDHDTSNIQALCKSCNSSKHDKIQKGFIISW